jgi:hypothetical protein
MEKIFALIRNELVEQTIVADEEFIERHMAKKFTCIRIDELAVRPGIGWSFVAGEFVAPKVPETPPAPEKPEAKPLRELKKLTKKFTDPDMAAFSEKLIEVFEASTGVKADTI